MSMPLIKSRLLVGNKHLGDLFYDNDSKGRGYLKLSFKNEIADFVRGTDTKNSTSPTELKLNKPIRLELSYKFKDQLFSIKRITKGEKNKYEFHKISLPVSTCLFYLRIKNWEVLDDDDGTLNSSLVLTPPTATKSIAIIFSFLGANGQSPCPSEYSDITMGCIDLPDQGLKNFCIGLSSDIQNNQENNIIIMFPVSAK